MRGQEFPYQAAVGALLELVLGPSRQDFQAGNTLLGPQDPPHLSSGPLDVSMQPLSGRVAPLGKTELLNLLGRNRWVEPLQVLPQWSSGWSWLTVGIIQFLLWQSTA